MKHIEVILSEVKYISIGQSKAGYWAQIRLHNGKSFKFNDSTLEELQDTIIERIEDELY